jgi:predicted AAA+ superfamily ATPase
MELKRYRHLDRLKSLLTCYPVVAILSSDLVLRQLQLWYANISQRQVKAAKVYIADSGLLHTLLNLPTHDDLVSHPKVGTSWEDFVLSEVLSYLGAYDDGLI